MTTRPLAIETNPMTGSSAEYLAGLYGNGASVEAFASSLPDNASIMDVGAGKSDFGATVANKRPGIRCINLDIQYNDPAKVEPLQASAPHNVTFVAGDVLDPRDIDGFFDRIYSYNLLSHLIRAERDLGERALAGMLGLLKPDGELSVGPTNAKMGSDARWGIVTLKADATNEQLNQAIAAMTTPRKVKWVYDAMDAAGVGIYPRGRLEPGKKGVLLSNAPEESYHPLFSRTGIRLAGRLTVAVLKRR